MLSKRHQGSVWPPYPRLAPRAIAFASAALFISVVASCGVGDTTDPVEEIRVGTITIDSSSFILERGTHKVISATVKDPKGKVISVPLVWRSSNENVAVFEPDGRLLARDTGIAGIGASALGVSSQVVGVRVKWEGPAKVVTFLWTAPEAATPGTVVPDSLRAAVTNIRDFLVPGVKVRFAVTAGGGSVSPALDTTTSIGLAATQWTLGPNPGVNTVTATVLNDDNTPNALATPNTVTFTVRTFKALEIIDGNAQQGLVLSKLPIPPAVRLVDSAGKPRLGVPVTFTATKGGQVKTPIVSTGADGIASPGEWTLGDVPGEQTLEVKVESATLSLKATATGTPIRYRPAQLVAGGYANCALSEDGLASCWGEQPKVGDGTDKNRPSPTPTKGDIRFKSLGASAAHFCGVTADSTAYCWGANVWIDTTARGLHTNVPTKIQGSVAWTDISPGILHTCGLSKSIPYCWGDNGAGQLGDRTTTRHVDPQPVYGGFQFSQLASGGYHTCGLTTAGSAFCWGFNANGQIGDGTLTNRSAPTVVLGALTFQSIGAGESWTCGLTTAGRVYCWGGVIGVAPQQTTPITYPTAPVFTSLAVGGGHACALTGTGVAYCWGENSTGQVGDSTTVRRPAPVAVAGGLKFSSLSAGYQHTCGRTTDGAVACWGLNKAGELGDSTSAFRLTPRFIVTGVEP
jgi:alpha-tubulin suppressor-like RCC1 family protein